MEENVALDTSKQKQFVKSIKGIKKLIKKAEHVPEEDITVLEPTKIEKKKKPGRNRPERGLVYLSHIPHGFYEHEMTQYFKQFGAVSNVRVIRSKRTGNSKGFAFIEFKEPAVAEIVAETMNNYLMGKRLLKAAYVPPEKQKHKAMRMHWSRFNNPGRTDRLKHKKAHNENKDEADELERARKSFSLYEKNMKKLSDLGINYDFFTPVDIPADLLENKDSQKTAVKTNVSKVVKKDKASEPIKPVPKKEVGKVEQKKVEKKKEKVEPVVNKKEQKQKQQKLKDSGVKPPENFIKVQEDDDSDSSVDFDSDDYNKALENDSDVESGDESDNEGSGGESDEFQITGSDDDSDVEESEEEQAPPPKKGKAKLGPITPASTPLKQKSKPQAKAPQQTQTKGSVKKEPLPKQIQKANVEKVPKVPQMGKRKASQKNAGSPKKPKFEKQSQQPMKKQFKKKK